MERHEAGFVVFIIVAKDHVWVHVRIQLADTSLVAFDRVCECRGRLCIPAGIAAAVVAWAFLVPIAINVHAGQLTILALYVHDSHVVEMVTTVAERCTTLAVLQREALQ